MKKYLFLFPIYLLLTFPAFAQKDFRPGYIVTLQNDTLRGLVNYKGDTKSALECSFKTSEISEIQKFEPEQLAGYGFTEGKLYESRKVKAIDHPYNAITMKFEDQPVIGQPEKNFMKILVKGTASLYYLVDVNAKPHFFLQQSSSELKELVLLEADVTDLRTGLKKHQRIPIYTGTLLNEFSACPDLKTQIERTGFKGSELSALVVAYNQYITPDQAILEPKKKKPLTTWTALAGVSLSDLKIGSEDHFLDSEKYSSKPALTLGLTFDISLPSINEKLSLNNGLFYTRRNYTNNIIDQLETYYYNQYQIDYNFTYLRLENTVRYTVPSVKLAPFMQAGITNNFLLKGEESISKTRNFNNYPPEHATVEPVLLETFRNYQLGLVAAIGLNYRLTLKHSLNIQTNYEYNPGFSNSVGFSTISHNIAVLTGISF